MIERRKKERKKILESKEKELTKKASENVREKKKLKKIL